MQPTLRFLHYVIQSTSECEEMLLLFAIALFFKTSVLFSRAYKSNYKSVTLPSSINEIIIISLLNELVHASYTLSNTA